MALREYDLHALGTTIPPLRREIEAAPNRKEIEAAVTVLRRAVESEDKMRALLPEKATRKGDPESAPAVKDTLRALEQDPSEETLKAHREALVEMYVFSEVRRRERENVKDLIRSRRAITEAAVIPLAALLAPVFDRVHRELDERHVESCARMNLPPNPRPVQLIALANLRDWCEIQAGGFAPQTPRPTPPELIDPDNLHKWQVLQAQENEGRLGHSQLLATGARSVHHLASLVREEAAYRSAVTAWQRSGARHPAFNRFPNAMDPRALLHACEQ